jgi:hypothetical protein
MFIKLKQVFDDVFEHLGVEIIFDPRTSEPVSIVALVKEPVGVYEVGGSQVIGQVAEFSMKSSDATPKIGDSIFHMGLDVSEFREYAENEILFRFVYTHRLAYYNNIQSL